MSSGVHLLVPFAACPGEPCREALRTLELPTLADLLARLEPVATDAGDAHDLSPPHERVLARAAGLWLGDGRVPQAAWQLRRQGGDPGSQAWAWLTPCHWLVGRDHIRMAPPRTLQLGEAESRTLLQAMRPYFEEDGIAIDYQTPTRWLARGELFRDLACASLARVGGAVVDDWLPRAEQARAVRRLQQEMQMLLYTHPVNEAREARGLAPVNSFWVSGAGALPPHWRPGATLPEVDDSLCAPALQGDWQAWAGAWRALEARALAPLRAALDSGAPVALTLCGAASARTWAPTGQGAWRRLLLRLRRILRRPPPPAQALEFL